MNCVMTKNISQQRSFNRVKKVLGTLGLSLLALLYLQFGFNAAMMGIWLQAIPVLIASAALMIGASRFTQRKLASPVVFWGTLPAWLIHVPTTIIFKDESPVFVIATGIPPIVAGISLLLQHKK
jgi:hypothetical protein